MTTTPAPTTTFELPPPPPPSTTTTANRHIAVLQSEISDEEAVLDRDTAILQGDQNELDSDTQWCNDPLDSGPFNGYGIGLLPCSWQLQIDEGAVSQDTQELSYARATLETEEQELAAASQ